MILRTLLFIFLLLTLAAPASAGLFSSSSDTASGGARSSWFGQQDTEHFLPVDQAFRPTAWRQDNTLYIGFESAAGYYLYRSRFGVESATDGVTLGALQLPAGEEKTDEFLGHVRVFHGSVVMSAPIDGTVQGAIDVNLTFQGCADAGLCYPPEHLSLEANEQAAPDAFQTDRTPATQPADSQPTESEASAPVIDPPDTPSALEQDRRFDVLLSDASTGWVLGLFFLAGLGLTFTPCVLPMLPIVSAIVVGQRAGKLRALGLSTSYVGGMAITYALLGVLIGLFGAGLNLQARLQSPWVLIPFALLFVVFALWMFGAFNLNVTGRLSVRLDRVSTRLQASGPPGIALTGALSTLIVSPCVSAPLAGAMAYVSATGDALLGGGALLAMGLGMGLPLILVSTLGLGLLPRSGTWMNAVKAAFGVMMLGVALWLVSRLLPAPLSVLLWGILSLGVGLALGALQLDSPNGWPRMRQAVGILALVWGILCIIGAARGAGDPLAPLHALGEGSTRAVARPALDFETVTSPPELDRALARAAAQGKPALVDYYADWCISCKELEHNVFTQPAVTRSLDNFYLIRADITHDTPQSRALLARFGLFGPPSLLFFQKRAEIEDSRTQGDLSAQQLLAHLEAVLRQVRH